MKNKLLIVFGCCLISWCSYGQSFLSLSFSSVNPSPATACNGSITVNVVNGPSGSNTLFYNWSNGVNGNGPAYKTISNLCAGSYSVTVYDIPCNQNDGPNCTISGTTSIPVASTSPCTLAYPDNSNLPKSAVVFNESDVLAAFDLGGVGTTSPTIRMFYNDEHAMTLGVRRVSIKTRSGTTNTDYPITPTPATAACVTNPLVGTTATTGDQAGNDNAAGGGRPLWPALFITDITTDPSNRSGDWQQGGVGIPPHGVCGTWKGAVKLIDQTKNPVTVTITPDADPRAKDHWSLGGGDVPPGGFAHLRDEGYGAEVTWNVNDLGLIEGHTYHLQFMVHDGDQNKSGGDVGEGCLTVVAPGSNKTSTGVSSINGDLAAIIYPNPSANNFNLKIQGANDNSTMVRVYDLTGKILQETELPVNGSDMAFGSDFAPGMYLVKVSQGNSTKTIRVTKTQ